jgi:glyoxylate/hydroxypyruvate reductase A
MADYVLGAVLRHHRRFDFYERLKHERVWQRTEPLRTGDRLIGVLGYGALGKPVAQRLRDNGFAVRVWRNSHVPAEGMDVFAGEDELATFFTGLDGVVGLLPLMPETIGIINAERLSLMKPGAFLINVGRGQHLDEDDLKPLLDSGHISGATLDVVSVEPLPDDHWLWKHPSVLVTPHVATLPRADTAVPFIAENVARVLRGEKPELAVER